MAVAVLDSNVPIAAVSRRDQNHETAAELIRGIDHGELPTGRLTNYVVGEVLKYVHERHQHETALDLHDRLKRGTGFDFVHATQSDFAHAEEIFHRYDELSFVDATIVSYMDRTDLRYLYSFDDDFDAVDEIVRLETPITPFD